MKCKCTEFSELNGAEAKKYAQNHLIKIRVDGETWQIEYKCPDTSLLWIMDFPFSESHGGGPPRLKKISS